MKSSSYLAPTLCALLFAACAEPPTAPDALADPGVPLFKPKCDSPPCDGGEDPPEDPPPPPTAADPAILYSGSSREFDLTQSIFQMNADGSNVAAVFGDAVESGNESRSPAWAPDGERFAFTRYVRVFDKRKVVSASSQLAVSDVDGTGLTVVREVSEGAEPFYRPRWSPEPVGGEERIAWVENRWSAGEAAILMARADTWDVETLLTSGPDEHFGNMTWSRTGDQILIEGWYESSQQSFLRLYDVDCPADCTATFAIDLDLAPLGSSDSFGHLDWAHLHDWVVVPARGDLWRIDMVTGDLEPLTETSIEVQDAVWSSCDDAVLLVAYGEFGRRWSNKLIRLNLSALPTGVPWDGSLDDPSVAEAIADVNPAGIDWRPTSSSGCD